jgi:hypothetical protein
MSNVNDLIDALGSGDMGSAQTHFSSIMNDKVQSALDAKKVEVAQAMYADQEELQIDTEVEFEDEVQGIETEAE